METKLKKWYSAPANLIGLICFWRHLVALNELLNSNSRVFLLTQHYHGMHILIILWKKAAKRLYFLKVLKRSGLTSDHLLHFCVAVIRPILEYCSPVWNHNLPQYISDKIDSIQKRAIRIIFSVTRGMSYIFALSYAELPSLQQRR